MNTFLTVLRQDLFAIRWAFVTWLALWFLLVLLPQNLAKASFTNVRDYVQLFGAMSWVVLAGVLFTRIALGHSPVDARNGWRTRPLVPALIAFEKLLLVAAVFLIPILAGNWASGNAPVLREPCYILLAALFVSSLVPTARALLAALLIITVIVLASLTLFFNRLSPFYAFGLDPTGTVLAQVLYLAGFTILLVRQYRHPHSLLHGIAGIGLLGVLLSLTLVFRDPTQPPPFLDRPYLQLHLDSAAPIADQDFPAAGYYNDVDRHFAEKSGTLRSHRNWSVRLSLAGTDDHELWFVRSIHAGSADTPGLGHRAINPPRFVPAGRLLSRLPHLGRGYAWVPPAAQSFEHHFQWVRWDGSDAFPAQPTAADFHLLLLRVDDLTIYVSNTPVAVGDYGPRQADGQPALSIHAVDYNAGHFDAVVTSRNVLVSDPAILNVRYTALTLVAFNPQTREAGLVERLPPAIFTPSPADPYAPQRYGLPPLAGDPRDIRLTLFMARADGQVILSGHK